MLISNYSLSYLLHQSAGFHEDGYDFAVMLYVVKGKCAAFTVFVCGAASFDAATIKHLVSNSMNLDYGSAGQVFIRNLAVEYAQMVGASIGNLCIKASDGKYYSIDVDASGNVTGTLTTVSQSEIDAALGTLKQNNY